MNWYKHPYITRSNRADLQVWRLTGDWTRDLPSDVKDEITRDLGKDPESDLILDLVDVSFIDSWGEHTIADLAQRVVEHGDRVVCACDDHRRSEYEGLEYTFRERNLMFVRVPTVEEATETMKDPA